ncbi:MAG TPA: 1-deoxy-D-xylulose-5-phosphate synthase [Candidatus Dormibacteraeota bacterium]|nr:1-deoxy-D-xylulose-5-phosphate synthase [Candidatus Dormibacteraeota bacterium]
MPKQPSAKTAALEQAISTAQAGVSTTSEPTKKATARAGRIMYIECKAGTLVGEPRIGRVTFSKTERTLYYRGKKFQSLKGAGFKSNYYDVDTGEDYWISGPKRNGQDTLYGGNTPIAIDEDVREEYWRDIRRQPERSLQGRT